VALYLYAMGALTTRVYLALLDDDDPAPSVFGACVLWPLTTSAVAIMLAVEWLRHRHSVPGVPDER
jgi:hypothetical protein